MVTWSSADREQTKSDLLHWFLHVMETDFSMWWKLISSFDGNRCIVLGKDKCSLEFDAHFICDGGLDVPLVPLEEIRGKKIIASTCFDSTAVMISYKNYISARSNFFHLSKSGKLKAFPCSIVVWTFHFSKSHRSESLSEVARRCYPWKSDKCISLSEVVWRYHP